MSGQLSLAEVRRLVDRVQKWQTTYGGYASEGFEFYIRAGHTYDAATRTTNRQLNYSVTVSTSEYSGVMLACLSEVHRADERCQPLTTGPVRELHDEIIQKYLSYQQRSEAENQKRNQTEADDALARARRLLGG